MLEKIYNFFDKFNDIKTLFKLLSIITTIFFIILCTIISKKNMWKDFIKYPETEYLNLEEEATRIIHTKNFESEYNLVITKYDNRTNYLSMELSNNSTESIIVNVNDFGKVDEEIILKRNRESIEENTLVNVLILFSFSLILGCLIILPIVFIDLILYIIIHYKKKFN